MDTPDTNSLELVASQFEAHAHQNGMCYWLDTDLMALLGYSDFSAFRTVVNKAIHSCTGLDINPLDDFIRHDHVAEDGSKGYYKFTRLACFLITQHADQSKQEVRFLQYCLARMADTVMEQADFERLDTRSRLATEEKQMSSVAKQHGVQDYAIFKDQGYRGMYNMSLKALKTRKGFKGVTLYDRMNNTELAANLFRITQTTERIKAKGLRGQSNLEQAAFDVGRSVRKIVRENMGQTPEALPLADSEIKDLKKEGKKAARNIRKLDAPKKTRKRKGSDEA